MSEVKNITGYYNLYDETKQYTELLFRAGKVLQSKEVNELQSMLKHQIKNIGDIILTNGDIVEGCQLITNSNNTVTISQGKVYLNGNTYKVNDTTISITGRGTENIGVRLKKEYISADEDETLRDVASGYDNYNQDGAFRLKETAEMLLITDENKDDPDLSIIYTLVDGQQLSVNNTEDLTQLDKINATLAKRTYDESGNYKVEGLELVNKSYTVDGKNFISMEAGRAYIKGYEVNKPFATAIGLDAANDVRSVENEPKIYKNGTNKYSLNNTYVSNIIKVVSIVQVQQNITRGSIIGGIDYLPLFPVVDIISIIQGDTTYVKGTDFQLLNDGVDWGLGGKEPNPGESYTVVWSYNKTMVKGTDYKLISEGEASINGFIQFLNGDKPINDSQFLINYEFKMCRRDVIALDKNGNVVIIKGQPDILRTVESPAVSNEEVLVLGSTLIKPNTTDVQVINNNTKNIPMLDLYKMLERISSLEYNQAISNLDQEAADGESATQLQGILTDGFLGLTKSDVYHSEYTASVDLDSQELTLPFDSFVSGLTIDNTTGSYGLFNRLLTAPYSEITLLSQPLATGTMRINSYDAFPKLPVVGLSPSVDNWVDTNNIVIDGGTRTKTVTLRRWWYHKNESWAQSEKALWQSYGLADGGESLGWGSATVSITRSVTDSVLSQAILYMRTKKVKVTVQRLEPYTDKLTATFDGKPVALSPYSTTYKSNTTGCIKADGQGKAIGYFTIPANTPCGSRELSVYPQNTPSLVGSATYTANGQKITTVKKVWTETVRLNPSDPLAQSFLFPKDQYLTGVGIYFYDKDATNPITIQVRNMVNGYPGNICYAEKTIPASSIVISKNAAVETKVKFDDPVYLNGEEQYCFTILSNSNVDSVFMAQTTENDITTKQQITKNPYLNGMMFSSSNALTWTAHQGTDLKFKIYGANFQTSGNVVFNAVENVSYDRIMVLSDESIPTGCGLQWKYRVNKGEWKPIETYDDRELNEIAERVDLQLSISSATNTSPAIALDTLLLAGFSNHATGTYISKNVSVPSGFNHVKIVLDLHIPQGANINVYYATDTNGISWKSLTNTSSVQKSTDYTTYTFEADCGATYRNFRCKIVLSTSSKVYRPTAMNMRSIMKTV